MQGTCNARKDSLYKVVLWKKRVRMLVCLYLIGSLPNIPARGKQYLRDGLVLAI